MVELTCDRCGSEMTFCGEDSSAAADAVAVCKQCGRMTQPNKAPRGLWNKYTVLRNGKPVGPPCFVVSFTDPAGVAAILAYAAATQNESLSSDLLQMIYNVRKHPDDYPPPGKEGSMNRGVKSTLLRSPDMSVVVITKEEEDDR